MTSLEGTATNLVGDRRLAECDVLQGMQHFPSLAVLSFRGSTHWTRVGRALKLRRYTVLKGIGHPHLSRVYLEVLFLLQAIRYDLAQAWVESLPKEHVWLSDFDRSAYCRPLIWQAKKLARTTATMVHGTPNQNYLPPVAENVLVWGEAQLQWFRAVNQDCTLHVVGRPDICKFIAPGPPKRLRVVHSMESLMETEKEALARLCSMARSWGLDVSLRLHPSVTRSDLDENWKTAAAALAFENKSENFLASLAPGDVVVGINSTAIIDALIIGVPAWTLADAMRELPCDLSKLRDASGPLLVVLSQPEQGAAVRLAGPDMLRYSRSLGLGPALVAATGAESEELLRRAVGNMLRD
ncbi:hypothetical protein [Arthrobacter sp. ISL-28]|uniref:hypothetical protein n=1 Tax=Arthrobacter sp. ISL-28 TaxID=2819108 RepID=UPI001BE7B66B|nr:hypothetical protein [Arthrobacter sp. ISL-28]MBT2519668.1 hypothetical protein [Arthrobacter sp. ISL-28]